MIVLTSFSKSGYDLYGRKFLENFVECWPCKVLVYYESLPDFVHEKVEYKNLFSLRDLVAFLTLIQDKSVCKGDLDAGYNYNFDVWKFCRKSFAQFDALKEHKGKVIWLDADTVTKKPITEEFIDGIFGDVGVVYLGREGFHTESGFVGFNTTAAGFEDFLAKYVESYRKGIIFSLSRWHDCAALDWAIEQSGVKVKNLSDFWKSGDDLHVMPKTILGEYIDHFKGNKKRANRL